MKITDIQWNSTIVEFSYTDENIKSIPVESEILLDYDNNSDKYFIQSDSNLFYVSPCGATKGVLDTLVRGTNNRNRISWVLDISDKVITIKICPFQSSQFLNEFQALHIEISNDIVQQLKQTSALDALPILEKQFMYKNNNREKVVFIIGISEF